jgi:hypothetical protein
MRRPHSLFVSATVLAVAALASALVCACGGESGDPVTITVVVPGATGSSDSLPGAAVALDRGDGSRAEGITGGDGTVTFDHANGAGAFAFTVAAAGYVAVTNLGVTEVGNWQVTLSPIGTDFRWVDLTGVVEGKKDVDHDIVISATGPSTVFDGFGPEYSLRVPPEPTSLIVCELTAGPAPTTMQGLTTTFVTWAQFSLDPVGGAPTDLALPGSDPSLSGVVGQSLVPATGAGTLTVPASMKGAEGDVRVSSSSSSESAFLGGASSIELAPNMVDLAYVAEYVVPTQEDDLLTTYELYVGSARSFAEASGVPGGDVAFLDPPTLASPQRLYGPLPVQGDFGAFAEIINIERDDENVVWRVFNQAASKGPGARLPRLPSSIDPRVILGTGRVSAIPEVCNADPTTGRCTQWADGAPADLVGP